MDSPSLSWLLEPFPSESFRDSHWEQKILHVSRSSPHFYENLLTFEELDILVRLATFQKTPSFQLVRVNNGQVERGSVVDNRVATTPLTAMYEQYADGYSLVVNRLHRFWPSVSKLCMKLQQELRYPVGANLYLTPTNAQCFKPHFDTHDVFVLQLDGSKTWRIYETPTELPLEGERFESHEALNSTVVSEVTLDPGDLLYIPRGTVHEARSSASSSLHLTVGIYVIRRLDVLRVVLERVAQDLRLLRGSVGFGVLNNSSHAWPPDARDEIFSRLRGILDDPATLATIQTDLAKSKQSLLSELNFSDIDKLAMITLNTPLRVRKGLECKVLRSMEGSEIQFGGNWMRGPDFIHGALEYVATKKEFVVSELPDTLTDDGKLTLARRLVAIGLLSTNVTGDQA